MTGLASSLVSSATAVRTLENTLLEDEAVERG